MWATTVGLGSLVLAFPVRGGARPRAVQRYLVVRAPYRPEVRYLVTYHGSGRWQTVYHSEPPNPGGAHDTNDAHDASTVRWSLRFTRPLTIARSRPGAPRARGCPDLGALTEATGKTSATGSIDHSHRDGLYRFDDASERCHVSAMTRGRTPLPATIALLSLPGGKRLSVTALIPVETVLVLLPSRCPGQADSLDGLADNYFTPGFSFAPGFGPQRWFTSQRVVIPLATLHRAARIVIHLSDSQGGTPPAGCAVPAGLRCRVSGRWNGTLTLVAQRRRP